MFFFHAGFMNFLLQCALITPETGSVCDLSAPYVALNVAPQLQAHGGQ